MANPAPEVKYASRSWPWAQPKIKWPGLQALTTKAGGLGPGPDLDAEQVASLGTDLVLT